MIADLRERTSPFCWLVFGVDALEESDEEAVSAFVVRPGARGFGHGKRRIVLDKFTDDAFVLVDFDGTG